MKKLAAVLALLAGLSVLQIATGVEVWAQYAESLPTVSFTANTAYQLSLFAKGMTGLYDYFHLSEAQASPCACVGSPAVMCPG